MNEISQGNKKISGSRMRKRIIAAAVLVVFLAGAGYGVYYFVQMREYKNRIDGITIDSVDMSKIEDGTYTGSYDAVMVGATVDVVVKDHAIETINIVHHKTERGQKAELITQEVISSQSLKVDIVSGATNSSKVILKAIENALESSAEK